MAQSGKFAFFPMYPKDFFGDEKVQLMKGPERAFYALSIFHAWIQNPPGTLPDDDAQIAKLLDLTLGQWRRIRHGVLSAYYFGDDKRWHQKRLEAEFRKISGLRQARAAAGSKGGCSKARNLLQQNGSNQNDFATIRASKSKSKSASERESERNADLNISLPRRLDPNGIALPRIAPPIDRHHPPFQLNSAFDSDEFKNVIKNGWLKYAEESHGLLYTKLEFDTLMFRFQKEFKTPSQAIDAITRAITKKHKSILWPSETGEVPR